MSSMTDPIKLKLIGKYVHDSVALPIGLNKAIFETPSLAIEQDIQRADLVLAFDCDREVVKVVRSLAREQKKVLIVCEPSVVWPMGSRDSVLNLFDDVAWLGRSRIQRKKVFPWPQSLEFNEKMLFREDRTDSTIPIVSANKLSAIHGELYSLRRMAQAQVSGVSLHGLNWDWSFGEEARKIIYSLGQALLNRQNFSPTWLNSVASTRASRDVAVQNKIEFLSRHARSLVIENSLEFLSEKLFDALVAGSYPIYVGPELEDFGLPKWLCTPADPNVRSIEMAIGESHKVDLKSWRQKVHTWLTSSDVEMVWLDVNVYKDILNWAAGFEFSPLTTD